VFLDPCPLSVDHMTRVRHCQGICKKQNMIRKSLFRPIELFFLHNQFHIFLISHTDTHITTTKIINHFRAFELLNNNEYFNLNTNFKPPVQYPVLFWFVRLYEISGLRRKATTHLIPECKTTHIAIVCLAKDLCFKPEWRSYVNHVHRPSKVGTQFLHFEQNDEPLNSYLPWSIPTSFYFNYFI